MTSYGRSTETQIAQIVQACERYGDKSIIALSGVPGTGKSFSASIAAQRYTDEPLFVREIQFHQSFSYEEFMEGMRIDTQGGVAVAPGVFLEWNERAQDDAKHKYVLLIEELTRANISAVLGELMTYIEYRDRPFLTMYSRRPVYVARNLVIMATYNPMDRSALEVDSALLRRMRIIQCSPSIEQLSEMLAGANLAPAVISKLQNVFTACQAAFPDDYTYLMPFGHGVFSGVQAEQPDLYRLWDQRLQFMLRRPLVEPHPFTKVIEDNYPWRKQGYKVPEPGGS